jgi:hypothetical protein
MDRSLLIVAVTLLGAGCTPVPTWHLGETAETLHARDVALSFSGGGGGNVDTPRCCGALGTKLRVGVGARQEISLAGNFGFSVNDPADLAVSAAVGYKVAPKSIIALLLDMGGSWTGNSRNTASRPALGSGFGFVLSSPHLGHAPVRLFVGGRFAWAVPIAGGLYGGFGPTENLVAPFGFTVEPGNVRLVFEGGFGGVFAQREQAPNDIRTDTGYYGYAAFTVTPIFRSRR